jgi:hypothetical protein
MINTAQHPNSQVSIPTLLEVLVEADSVASRTLLQLSEDEAVTRMPMFSRHYLVPLSVVGRVRLDRVHEEAISLHL